MSIEMDNQEIDHRTHTTFLGEIIYSNFNWNRQIQHVYNKVSKCIGILSKVKGLLLKDILLTLYYSLAFPYIMYCNNVSVITHPSMLLKITVLQNKIVHMICSSHCQAHSNSLFKELRTLNIFDVKDKNVTEKSMEDNNVTDKDETCKNVTDMYVTEKDVKDKDKKQGCDG